MNPEIFAVNLNLKLQNCSSWVHLVYLVLQLLVHLVKSVFLVVSSPCLSGPRERSSEEQTQQGLRRTVALAMPKPTLKEAEKERQIA